MPEKHETGSKIQISNRQYPKKDSGGKGEK